MGGAGAGAIEGVLDNEDGQHSEAGAGAGQARRSAAERLLAAGARLFAERGYADVSTRALARAAGVNLSAITYYFDGKEGLYRAVIARMLRETEPLRRALIDDIRAGILRAGSDRAALARVALAFVRRVLAAQVLTALPGGRMQIMLREVNKPSVAFDDVMAGHIDPVHDAVCELVAAARHESAEDESVRILAHAVIGQCVVFGPGRHVIQSRLGWDEVTPKRFERIVDAVGRSVLASLGLQTGADAPPAGQ
jgi:AcrR family transcriptional regulator